MINKPRNGRKGGKGRSG